MEPAIGPDGQPVPAFEVIVRRSHDKPRFCVDGVPQEEIRIAKDTRRLARCRFIAHEVKRSYGDLLAEGWPKAELDRMAADDSNDGEMAARHAPRQLRSGNPVDNRSGRSRSPKPMACSTLKARASWNTAAS